LYDEREDDVDDDVDEDEDELTAPCPHCGVEIYEDAERCPHCGQYLSEEDRPAARRPWWIIVGASACLYAVYRWITG
jgi:hypothetical protein